MHSTTYVSTADPHAQRITVESGLACRSLLVEEREGGVWRVRGHVDLPDHYTDKDIDHVIETAVDTYLDLHKQKFSGKTRDLA